MLLPFCLLYLFRIIITTDCTTRVGYIYSAAYIPTNSTNVLLHNGTCSECICFAFMLNNSLSYEALNCYTNNKTCLLFTSFLSQSYIQININSTLVFLRTPTDTLITTAATPICVNINGTCGGNGWAGSTNCCTGLSCNYINASYSNCLRTSTASPTLISTSSSTTVPYVNNSRLNASTGTYWDCCKVSCGWPGKALVSSTPKTCKQDGVTAIADNTQSGCNNGSSYMCTNQQPWNVSGNLSYGYAGAGLTNKNESDWCCACYSLVFTSGSIIGKEMIVQVINTAYPFSNTFVLQIPGSGWGGSSNGCSSQFNSSYSWGQPAGGFTNRSDCNNLPSVLQAGCYWRFDWFMNANNPTVSFTEVSCPLALTIITGCTRL